jgi:hypothetical protein
MGTTATLKARLRGIMAHATRPERLLAGSTLALTVIGTSLLLTASIGNASLQAADHPADEAVASRQAQSDGAKADAQATLGQREADLGEAEAKLAQREAEAALHGGTRAGIDASRSAIEASRQALHRLQRGLVAMPAPPAPPAPPSAPAIPATPSTPDTPVAFGADPGAAPALQRRSGLVECPENAHHRQIVSANEDSVQVVVIDCDGTITTLTNASTKAGLIRARARIEALEVLTGAQRATAMTAIDKAMQKFRSPPPPYSLQ